MGINVKDIEESDRYNRQKKVLSVYNQKGGVGKTSLTVLLSLFGASLEKKILMIDLDPQESLSQSFSGTEKTVFHWLTGHPDVIQSISENLSLIRGDLQLIKIQAGILYNQIDKLLNKFNYDLIILDLPPTYNQLVTSAIYASDVVLVPTLQSEYDKKSLLFTLDTVTEVKQDIEKIIVFNRQPKTTKEIDLQFLSDTRISSYPIYFFPNMVSIRKAISKKILSNKISYQIESLFHFINGL